MKTGGEKGNCCTMEEMEGAEEQRIVNNLDLEINDKED